jgi:hypothetical protein
VTAPMLGIFMLLNENGPVEDRATGSTSRKWPGAESNCRHADFQSFQRYVVLWVPEVVLV